VELGLGLEGDLEGLEVEAAGGVAGGEAAATSCAG